MQTALKVLTEAEELDTLEFIALIDQLEFPAEPGFIAQMIMRRIAAREAPSLILLNPPSELWQTAQNGSYTNIAFLELLQTEPKICQQWFMDHENSLSKISRGSLKRVLLRHNIETDPVSALASITKEDLRDYSYLFRVTDPSLRAEVAVAVLAQFKDDPDQKHRILNDLIIGSFKKGSAAEVIHDLNTFFPGDADGSLRIGALRGSQYSLTEDHITKLLDAAKSISLGLEHQFIAAAASKWAREDLTKASAWLNEMPKSPLRDSAISGFSNRVSFSNPAAALEWAANISDPAEATSNISEILSRWEKADPEAASAWKTKNR
jgi:hypothetical protein